MSTDLPLIISVISLLISAITIMERIYTSRINIQLKLVDYLDFQNDLMFFIFIENNSRLPISITNIKIRDSKNEYKSCLFEPKIVKESSRMVGNEVVDRVFTKTMPIPTYINSLGAINGYICFTFPQTDLMPLEKPLNFLICTNRGKKKKMLSLPKKGSYLRA